MTCMQLQAVFTLQVYSIGIIWPISALQCRVLRKSGICPYPYTQTNTMGLHTHLHTCVDVLCLCVLLTLLSCRYSEIFPLSA